MSVLSFTNDAFIVSGFSPNLVCALLLWKSELGLQIIKFHQFLTELSACNLSIFLFVDNNLSKLDTCMRIDIVVNLV